MKETPLNAKHLELGAKMVNYAGYEMPVQYTNVIEEHLAVRSKVGIFDLSHMGEFELHGVGALDTINYVTTNDASNMEPGQIQYTCLTDQKGGIIDDILIYRTESGFFLVVNAANAEKDYAWLEKNLKPETNLVDQTNNLTLIAVQGPLSAMLVEEVLNISVESLKNYTFIVLDYKGEELLLSRTGYTGEDGFELYFPNKFAAQLWNELIEKGKKHDVVPVGLAARDTLRLEARLPLYGNDINSNTTPLEAGLGRFVKLNKDSFIGKEVLELQKEQGVTRKLIAFTLVDKGIPRQGYPILNTDGKEIGIVTSGTLSPSLNEPIGMGYVDVDYAITGTEIQIQIRKRLAKAEIIKGRFIKNK